MTISSVPPVDQNGRVPLRKQLAFRIVGLFLSLLLIIQLVTFSLVQRTIDRNARALLTSSLDLGEQVLKRLLEQNATHLIESTRVLAADFGFRAALSSGDNATLVSALENQAERVGARFALVSDAQEHIRAGTVADAAARLAPMVQRAIENARKTDGTQTGDPSVITPLDSSILQLVAVPVKAPLLVGWVVMAFELDARLAHDVKQLTDMRLVVAHRNSDKTWRAPLSTLSPTDTEAMLHQWMPIAALSLTKGDAQQTFEGLDARYEARLLLISNGDQAPVHAVMLRSIDEAVAPFKQLQWAILVLSSLGVLAFAMGSVLTANRITQPVSSLTRFARKLADGEFDVVIPQHGEDEIGRLAEAFEAMRLAVHEREQEIRRSSLVDSLTRLPNRAGFMINLRGIVRGEASAVGSCAVLILNINRFRHVNNVLGTDAGDQLLQRVASLLVSCVGSESHIVARIGGDEFAILLANGSIERSQAMAHSVGECLDTKLELNGSTVDLSASMGIAVSPVHATDEDALMRCAELAMHHAKQAQTSFSVFRPEMDVKSDVALSLLGELRQAIERQEFQLFLQPKVLLQNGHLVGAEALIRWKHPTRGMVPPGLFIPFAEQSGFIRQITNWLLIESMRIWRALADQGVTLQMSINLSARDLIDTELPARVRALLIEHRVPASAMCLEITESAIMDDPQRAEQTLAQFSEMGLQMSIDDFGTGYSSLAYLKRLPVHELKIDRSFVMNMHIDPQDAKIVQAVVDLAHNLGLKVTAEGLEVDASWHLLAELGCDIAQGYWIAKPMPAEELVDWSAQWISRVREVFKPLQNQSAPEGCVSE